MNPVEERNSTLDGSWQCSPRMVAQVEHPEHQEAAVSRVALASYSPTYNKQMYPLGKGSLPVYLPGDGLSHTLITDLEAMR